MSTTTRFINLTDDCVQLIFDRIPTQHLLLHVRLVSRAWQRHQQLNCREIREALIILQGECALARYVEHDYNEPFIKHNIDQDGRPMDYKFFINHHKLHISPKRFPKHEFFTKTFPNLCTLIVSIDRTKTSFLRSLAPLIREYDGTLFTLKMYFDGENKIGERNISVGEHFGKLMDEISCLRALQHLTFHIDDWSMTPRIGDPVFLYRVSEFYFDFIKASKSMDWWVEKFEKGGKLDKLTRFYSAHHDTALFESLFDDMDTIHLANRYAFSPFDRHQYRDNEQDLTKIVNKFVSLTTFQCSIESKNINSLTKLTTILSPLSKLVHLYLSIRNLPTIEPFNDPNSTQSQALASVKALDLYFGNPNRDFLPTFYQTQVETIVQCFPSLQSIRVSTTLYDDDEHYKSELDEPVRQFFDNLKVAYGRPSLSTKYFE